MSLDISKGKLITFNDGTKIKCGVQLVEESKTKIGLYRISSLFYNRYPAGYQAKLLNK